MNQDKAAEVNTEWQAFVEAYKTLAESADSNIIPDPEGPYCKSCNMEISNEGNGHKDTCLAVEVLSLATYFDRIERGILKPPQSPTPSDAKAGRYELRRCRDGYFCGTLSLIYCDGKEVFGPRQLYPGNSVGPDKIEQHAQTIIDALRFKEALSLEGKERDRAMTEIMSTPTSEPSQSSHNEAVKAVEWIEKHGEEVCAFLEETSEPDDEPTCELRALLDAKTKGQL
jgi:hypothetical protein